MIGIDEAIVKTMIVLGVSREEAAKMIQLALHEGKLKSTYTRKDGVVEILPPDTWRKP
jgi:hypothetical protein